MADSKSTPIRYRTLRPGDPIPQGKPQRVITRKGYVQLRWYISADLRVEVLEHRLVMGLPPADMAVHHKNHDKQDNRRENLELIPHRDHSRLHNKVSVNEAAVIAEYIAGDSLPMLSKRHGLDSGNLSRLLRRRGVQMRKMRDYRTVVDLDALRRMHAAGDSLGVIADALGTTVEVVRHRAREIGLPSRPAGRPRRTR